MKKLLLLLGLFAGAAFGQCTNIVLNPLTGRLDCTGAVGPAGATGATGATGAPGTGNNAICADASGSTTTYTCPTPSPTVSTLTGLLITLIPQATNSASATANVSSLGAKTLKKPDCTTNLAASDLTGGTAYIFSYNGTNFCQSFGSIGPTGATGPTGPTGATGTPGTGNNALCSDATGSTTAYTCPSPAPAVSTLTGLLITLIPQTTNTASATVNVSGLGVKTLKASDCSTNLVAGALVGGSAYLFSYNGTVFCQSAGAGGGSGTGTAAVCAATMSSNAATCTVSSYPAYVNTTLVIFTVSAANTGATTLNINGLGVQNITRGGTAVALTTGELVPGEQYILTWDGTEFQLQGPAKGIGITYASDGTIATNSSLIPQYYTSAGAPAGSCVTGRDFDIDTTNSKLYFCVATAWVVPPFVGSGTGEVAINSGSLFTVKKFAAFFGFGDSYMLGTGTTTPTAQSGFALLAKSLPSGTPAYNKGVGGFTADAISFNAFTYFGPSPTLPVLSLLNGGANDATCGTSASCITNYKEEMMGSEAWLTIPYSARIMGSIGTGASWVTDNSFPSYNPGFGATAYIASPGVPVSTTTNGASKTFSIPSSASPVVGVTFEVTNAQAGTFTISVDGTLQTDLCSASTTFTSGPCGGLTLGTQTTTAFRQEFTVTPNQTHTVIITTTNTSKVNILCVDWIPASTANLNTVFVMNTTAQFTNFATYNTASAAVAAQLKADGLPVYYVDLVGGTPGVNNTTDIATSATASCDASTTSGHPNSQCGYVHMAQTVYNAEIANSVLFGTSPVSANLQSASGVPTVICNTDLSFRSSAVSSAALCITPSSGRYRVTYYAAVGTAATTSSILGGTTGMSIVYLDGTDFVTRTVTLPEINQSGTSLTVSSGNTTNTTAAIVQGSAMIYANSGTAMTYSFGYTSVGGTAMQYQIHVIVEAFGI